MYEKRNQAYTMHPDFFDPLHQYASLEMNPKDPEFVKVQYHHEEPSVTVNEDGSVTFYMYAPKAAAVAVGGMGGFFSADKVYLTPDGKGGFRTTIQDFPYAMHYYMWYVDDVPICNPKAGVNYGCFHSINTFDMADANTHFYELQDVPHGQVHICKYISAVNQHIKECYVYTPPGYDRSRDRNYPVLYLQHGVGENETGWVWQGRMQFIMDNLLYAGKCREMLVVMCSGYAFEPEEDPVFFPGDFDKELTESVIPFIEQEFRCIHNRWGRAVAGLSLGSAQATLSAGKHPELFSALGVFSGVGLRLFREYPMGQYMQIFLSCGSYEEELHKEQERCQAMLLAKGNSCIQKTYEGFHEWKVWRESLHDFVQLLFQNEELLHDNIIYSKKMTHVSDVFYGQTMEESMMFFDPVYKMVRFDVDEQGNPAGRYIDMPRGIHMLDEYSVEFNLYAPGADKVEVDVFDCGKLELRRSVQHEGYWTGILGNLEKGFHYVTFDVNGTRVVNPDAPVGYGCFQTINYIEVPEKDFEYPLLRDIPHGHVRMDYYTSSQTGRQKLCYVYTPPGYETGDKSYPVLYLQHGGGENEIGWLRQGKIANMADELIAGGSMEEMVIVMNTGYAFREDGTSHGALSSFEKELVMDCIPYIDTVYRTMADREHRAMAGLSMGGMQTQRTVFEHTDLFAWAGIFSGGLVIRDEEVDYHDILLNPDKFRETFHMLYVACGDQDNFYEKTRENAQQIINRGVELTTFFDTGRHDWTFWRHCCVDFLQRIFRR